MTDNQRIKDKIKQETRMQIMKAGIKHLAKYGYHGTKIAAVARDAGVANGTYYLHFKDKDELYKNIVKLAISQLASHLFTAHNFHVNPAAADREEISSAISFAEKNQDLMRIALNNRTPDSPLKGDVFAPLVELRAKELQKGVEAGNIHRQIHPVVAARAELGMIVSVIQWWLDNNQRDIARDDVIETLTHLRRSWSTQEEPVDDIDSLLAQWDSKFESS